MKINSKKIQKSVSDLLFCLGCQVLGTVLAISHLKRYRDLSDDDRAKKDYIIKYDRDMHSRQWDAYLLEVIVSRMRLLLLWKSMASIIEIEVVSDDRFPNDLRFFLDARIAPQ